MTIRLSPASLGRLPPEVGRPRYDRAAIAIGQVHLGLGAFHRAHQAAYTDDLLAAGAATWAIAGVSLRHPDVRDMLAPQQGLYTLATDGGDGRRLRIVGAIRELVVAPESPAAVLDRLADPQVRVVTITVTEKGYHHDPARRVLLEHDPGIRHDLARPDRPVTVLGFLTESLRRRRAASVPPFTVVCCDNLPSNGDTLGRLLRTFADRRDPDLAGWIERAVPCPNTMVDRIVPATTEEDRTGIAARLGLADAGPVIAEPFRQWVIEDRFAGPRPPWEDVGAELVADVAPYERMKLRLLNGGHSTLAYLGALAGCETIADAMADPGLARLVADLLAEEAAPTLSLPAGVDLAAYREALLARFANPGLRHRALQIAMDGSQKLPQRLLDTARDRLRLGQPVDRLALGVAAWMRFLGGIDDDGRPLEIRDPLAGRLQALAMPRRGHGAALVDALLGVRAVFGDDLPSAAPFVAAVKRAMLSLERHGARRTAASWPDAPSEAGCRA